MTAHQDCESQGEYEILRGISKDNLKLAVEDGKKGIIQELIDPDLTEDFDDFEEEDGRYQDNPGGPQFPAARGLGL